jgi:hypothetical protein
MKPNALLTALLALTIQGMVQGQTPANQEIKNYEMFFTGNLQKLSLSPDEQAQWQKAENTDEILKQADELAAKAKALREEATRLEQQALIKKIIASEINGRNNHTQYVLTKERADSLYQNSTLNTKEQINSLLVNAGREIKIAKEMREEAYSWANNAARLGTLSNAEEKETLSLTKLAEAVTLLKNVKRYNGSTPSHLRTTPVVLGYTKTIN